MLKKKEKLVIMILLLCLLLSATGCATEPEGSGGEDDPSDDVYDPDDTTPRFFAIADEFPYPGKDYYYVFDKPTGVPHEIYIYVINNGGNWKENDVQNIKITYVDKTHSTVKEYTDFHILENDKDKTYIRVDGIIYPDDARGYFIVEGDIKQGSKKWQHKTAQSNLFNYGDPPNEPPPVSRDNILYEKEIVD